MPNDFYTPTGNPPENTAIVSTDMRAEFAAINAGFNKLPGLTGNANKLVVINSSGTGMDVTVAPAGLTSINKIALTQPANGATFTLLDGKTLTVNNTLTLAGTDSTVMTFPATSASVARIDAAQTFEGVQDFNGRIDANAGLAVTGANFTSRGISDAATAVALTLSGSGANSVTIANSATNPTIGTSGGGLVLSPANGALDVGTGTTVETINIVGTGSGVSGGARLQLNLGGSVTIALGNKSALLGGAYDNVGLLTSYYDLSIAALGADQVRIVGTASADRYITLTGSNGGNPTIGTSGGYLNHSATVLFSGPTAPLATTTGTYANSTAVGFVDSTRTADNRQFDLTFSAGTIKFRALNDAYTQAANAIAILGGYGAGITGINLYTSAAGAAGTIQVAVTHTAAANRYITLTGSNGGNPTIGTSAGALLLAPATGFVQLNGVTTSGLLLNAATGNSALVAMYVNGTEVARIIAGAAENLLLGTSSTGTTQVSVTHTASANRYITLTGSNGGNPTIGTSGGSLALSSVINYIGTGSTDYAALYGGTGAFTVQAAGGSANIALQLIAKGTGAITFGNLTETQVAVTNTASANRYLTLTGSNGGNPTIGTSAGSLAITPPVIGAGYLQAVAATATPAGGTAGAGVFMGSIGIGIYFGSGAPTVSASKGSIYLRSDGSATNNRMYVNTDGGTTWTAVTTAA